MRPESIFKILGCLALLATVVTICFAMLSKSPLVRDRPSLQVLERNSPSQPFVPLADLLAHADLQAGKNVARICSSCHSFGKGEPAKVGPNLYGIVGAPYAHMPNYHYSDAMMSLSNKTWTLDNLNTFLFSPRAAVPGNKMPFVGVRNENDRADLLLWLNSLSDNPQPIEGK